MIKYEDYRPDKNFKIDSLTYSEIFLGLKEELIKIISDYNGEEVKELSLIENWCSARLKYGKDKDLYPLLVLQLKVDNKSFLAEDCFIEFMPFEIKLYINKNGNVKEFESKELNNSLKTFMCNKFPNSDYLKKYEKYFKLAEIISKTEENMLNF